MTVGNLIKQARVHKGLTQKALGELLGVSQAVIQRYEAGGRNPKVETLQRIADALGVYVGEFIPQIDIKQLSELDNMQKKRRLKEYVMNFSDIENIAELIKLARKTAGLTQKELGERMGVSSVEIEQYESGKQKPTVHTLLKMAKAFDVNIVAELLYSNSSNLNTAGSTWIDGVIDLLQDFPEDKRQTVIDYIEFQHQKIKNQQKSADGDNK